MHALSDTQNSVPRSTTSPSALYADAADQRRHLTIIEGLSQEIDCPVLVLAPIYEQTLARMKSAATIPDYLPILVAKGVRLALKQIDKNPH